jgi:hypothetical protein
VTETSALLVNLREGRFWFSLFASLLPGTIVIVQPEHRVAAGAQFGMYAFESGADFGEAVL